MRVVDDVRRPSSRVLAVVLAAAVAVPTLAGCGTSKQFRKVAAVGRLADLPGLPTPPAPPPEVSGIPTPPTVPVPSVPKASVPAVPTVAPPSPPPKTTRPPTHAPDTSLPKECQWVSPATIAEVVGAATPPTASRVNPNWCAYDFGQFGVDQVTVMMFYGQQGDDSQGTRVSGLDGPAWWNEGGKTLAAQLPNGLVWIIVNLSAETRNGKEPKDIAIAVLQGAAPRLP